MSFAHRSNRRFPWGVAMVEHRGKNDVEDAMRELDSLLEGIGQEMADASIQGANMTAAPSGALYTTITRYWPRIAAGLVGLAALSEWLIGGLATSSGLEMYVFAWATATGGLWFMFDKAETSLSAGARRSTVIWLSGSKLREGIVALPAQFIVLFDQVFGKRHLSVRCFVASGVASLISVAIVTAAWVALKWPVEVLTYYTNTEQLVHETYQLDWMSLFVDGGTVLVLGLLFNLIPDFLSLLQTRFLLGMMANLRRPAVLLGVDLILTATLSIGLMYGAARYTLIDPLGPGRDRYSSPSSLIPKGSPPAVMAAWELLALSDGVGDLRLEVLHVTADTVVVDPARATRAERNLFDYVGAHRDEWASLESIYPRDRRDGYQLVGTPSDSTRATTEWRQYMGDWRVVNWDSLRGRIWQMPKDWKLSTGVLGSGRTMSDEMIIEGFPLGIFFYSAFFTSIWLWLYVLAVFVSRVLLRMNSGVGFLLRASDVEQHPFRSMGFVSVLIVTVLFLAGLPLVLF
jgi:hypothetical protein